MRQLSCRTQEINQPHSASSLILMKKVKSLFAFCFFHAHSHFLVWSRYCFFVFLSTYSLVTLCLFPGNDAHRGPGRSSAPQAASTSTTASSQLGVPSDGSQRVGRGSDNKGGSVSGVSAWRDVSRSASRTRDRSRESQRDAPIRAGSSIKPTLSVASSMARPKTVGALICMRVGAACLAFYFFDSVTFLPPPASHTYTHTPSIFAHFSLSSSLCRESKHAP